MVIWDESDAGTPTSALFEYELGRYGGTLGDVIVPVALQCFARFCCGVIDSFHSDAVRSQRQRKPGGGVRSDHWQLYINECSMQLWLFILWQASLA